MSAWNTLPEELRAQLERLCDDWEAEPAGQSYDDVQFGRVRALESAAFQLRELIAPRIPCPGCEGTGKSPLSPELCLQCNGMKEVEL